MIIKKWNKKLRKYEDYEAPEGCTCYSSDMEKIITCPSCGKKLKFGNGYTSNVYYSPNGIWGMIVCKQCNQKELVGLLNEKPKLTKFEKDILKNFDAITYYKYIARDADGSLFLFRNKPVKDTVTDEKFWNTEEPDYRAVPFSNLFKFIKWEDDEPTLISDLLKEEK